MTLASEARRPGITKLYQRLKRENPDWPDDRCVLTAKSLYTDHTIAAKVDGVMVQVPNPDYLAAQDR